MTEVGVGTVTELSKYRDKNLPSKPRTRVVVGLNSDDNRVYVSFIGEESFMFGMEGIDAGVLGEALTKASKQAAGT